MSISSPHPASSEESSTSGHSSEAKRKGDEVSPAERALIEFLVRKALGR